MICRVICDLFCYHLFVGTAEILHKVKHDQFFVRTLVCQDYDIYTVGLMFRQKKKYFLKLLIKSYNSNQ